MSSGVYHIDQEESYYSDILKQLNKGVKEIYVYNKNLIEKIEKQFPDLKIEKRDFYWIIINERR